MNLTPEIVISTLALACSLYALWQTRKHNRLSLVPHLELPFHREQSMLGIGFKLTLRNTGLGPAIVLDRWYSIDGVRHQSSRADPLEELIAQRLEGKVRYQIKRHGLPGIGCILPAGHQICIYHVFLPGVKAEQEDEIIGLVEGIEFEGRYRSVHGDIFPFSTKDRDIVSAPVRRAP